MRKVFCIMSFLGAFFSIFLVSKLAMAASLEWPVASGQFKICESPSGNLVSDSCPNGFSAGYVTISSYGTGSKLSVSIMATKISADAAFMYKLTVPAAMQVYGVHVANGRPPVKADPPSIYLGLSDIITDELVDGLVDVAGLNGMVFAFKLFTVGNLKAGGDPDYLAETKTPILNEKYYPYVSYEGVFVRRDIHQTSSLDIYFKRPLNDVLRYLRIFKASVYIGVSPSNEILIEGLRYKP